MQIRADDNLVATDLTPSAIIGGPGNSTPEVNTAIKKKLPIGNYEEIFSAGAFPSNGIFLSAQIGMEDTTLAPAQSDGKLRVDVTLLVETSLGVNHFSYWVVYPGETIKALIWYPADTISKVYAYSDTGILILNLTVVKLSTVVVMPLNYKPFNSQTPSLESIYANLRNDTPKTVQVLSPAKSLY